MYLFWRNYEKNKIKIKAQVKYSLSHILQNTQHLNLPSEVYSAIQRKKTEILRAPKEMQVREPQSVTNKMLGR